VPSILVVDDEDQIRSLIHETLEQDGLQTTMVLRREFPDVKVIVMTGGSGRIGILNFLDVAKMLGAHSTLKKPFEMKTLLDTVQAELQG
jgi:two-component system, chemotaxis family, chemotaxis protein CheY